MDKNAIKPEDRIDIGSKDQPHVSSLEKGTVKDDDKDADKEAGSKVAGRRSSWSFEPIPNAENQSVADPSASVAISKPDSSSFNNASVAIIQSNQDPSAGSNSSGQAQVEIIPSQVQDQPVQLTQEELAEAEKQRQYAEKMKGCPFFAGISRENAKGALQQHEAIIAERKASGKVIATEASEPVHQSQEEQKDLISAAMSAFSGAPQSPGLDDDDAPQHVTPSCPISEISSSVARGCPVAGIKNAEDLTLYDQFGGDAKMQLFVSDFMENLMGDPQLACYHEKFQQPEEMEILQEKLCQYFKFKLDGSRYYIGKSMTEVHKNLGISDQVFDSACEIFTSSVKKMKPKLKVMREFVKRINGIRD